MERGKESGKARKRVRKIEACWTYDMTIRLIELVESREAVWNFLCNTYRDRNAKDTAWEDIAEQLELPRSEVTAKWNSIRGSFRATRSKLTHTKSSEAANAKIIATNPYYKALKFLEPTLKVVTHTTSNFKQVPEAEEKKSCKVEPHDEKYDEILEEVLGMMRKSKTTDSWDAVGNLITSNGRELATKYPQLSSEFKSEVIKLVSQFEEKSLTLLKSSED